MKIEFSRQIFEKYSNVKYYKNPSSGSRVVKCGKTDRHNDGNSRFFFRNFAKELKNSTVVEAGSQSAVRLTFPGGILALCVSSASYRHGRVRRCSYNNADFYSTSGAQF